MAVPTTLSFVVKHLPTVIKLIRVGVPMLIELYSIINPRESISMEELREKMDKKKNDANAKADAKAEEIEEAREK